ncbi:MAG: hypothetical protein HP491_06960 [Nitrospira sp.]|nr:hypothetical protein [Nitrospira sp.]MBH0183007.1 hypothetical protein [Nitrospira sp.]MBH0187024.1 hypothetical protein [Nitrospira sp.]
MRHRSCFERFGLAAVLLVAGVLGGLVAPLSSKAENTKLTLQIDNGPIIDILGSSVTCTDQANYNQCFAIRTDLQASGGNPSRTYGIRGVGTAAPRINMNDRLPIRGKVTTIEVYPTTTAWGCTNSANNSNQCAIRDEVHVIKMVFTNRYLNGASGGSFTIGLRSGGMVIAGPSTSSNCGLQATGLPQLCNTQYDRIEFKGFGDFDTNTTNALTPLLGVAPANPSVEQLQSSTRVGTMTWTTQLDQDAQFPTSSCNTGTPSVPACQPTITTTYTVTLYGPDVMRLNDSNDIVGGGCKVTPADDGVTSPSGPPVPCHSSGKKKSGDSVIAEEFNKLNLVDLDAAAEAGAEQGVQCTVADNCPCADPETCKGSIVTKIRVTPTTGVNGRQFNFTTNGDFGSYGINPPFTIVSTNKGLGSYSFSNLLTVGRSPWIIAQGSFPIIDANTFYDTDNIDCVSLLNKPAVLDGFGTVITPAVTVTTWTVGGSSEKGPVTVNQLGSGDILTCEWHIHKNSGN